MPAKPHPRVQAAGAVGAASIVLVWALAQAGVDMPAEVASAVTTLLSFAAAYLRRD